MKSKYILLPCILIAFLGTPSQAQLLKKLKEKANKTLGNNDDNKSQENKSSSDAEKENQSSSDNQKQNRSSSDNEKQSRSLSGNEKEKDKDVNWCDTISATGSGDGKNGVGYSLAYSSPGNIRILYDESSLGIDNDAKGYRLILTEKVKNKLQFIVVENGKVVDTDTQVKAKYLTKRSSENNNNDQAAERAAAMKKYIIGDTLKQDIPKTDAKSVTMQKIDEDQVEMGMAEARQSEEYKSMTDAEKKEFEEYAREGIAKNNAAAGTTVTVPAQQGGVIAMVTGYKLIVKGKNYGKFQMPPVIDVSPDETKVFAVGVDEKSAPVMLANGKKIMLDKNKFQAMGGYILRSPDLRKFVYIEQTKLTDKEVEALSNSTGANSEFKYSYNVVKSDGSILKVTDYNESGTFKLTNTGAVISINEKTGQVFADNKVIGKFPLQGRDMLESEAVMIGNDISQIAYYNGAEGSLTYLDGVVRKLDITYPKVVSENGKSYLSWFRKCKNDIYIARFAY